MYYRSSSHFTIICVGENSEGTRAAETAAEEANGIGTTKTPGREKEVRYSTKSPVFNRFVQGGANGKGT